MNTCQHCGLPIEWNRYWTSWDHSGRRSQATAELCQPKLGFDDSKVAAP